MSLKKPDFNDPITVLVLWDRVVFIADQADSALGRVNATMCAAAD